MSIRELSEKATLKRNQNEPDYDVINDYQERVCKGLCFFDVPNELDEDLSTCLISNGRTKRDLPYQMPMKRLSGGTTVYTGSLPYVVRLTFQTFDQFHSDTQAGVWKFYLE